MSTGTRHANNSPPTIETEPASARRGLLDQVVEATNRERFSIGDVETMAKNAARSNMYGMNDAQAFTLMMVAESKGLHPIQAMERYHIIEGRPSMRADAMQAEFQRRGGQLRWISAGNEECTAEMWHPALHPDHLFFTANLKELVDTGVATAWDKDNKKMYTKKMYIKFPRQMLRARVISEGVRAIDPGVVVGIYTPEEVADMDAEDGPAPAASGEKSKLAAALDDARRRRPVEPAEAPPPAPRSDFRAWLDAEVEAFNTKWQGLCLDHKVDPGKGITTHQTINGLFTQWIKGGQLDARMIQNDEGRRDRDKMGAFLTSSWEESSDSVKEDVGIYLMRKATELSEQAGFASPDAAAGAPGVEPEPEWTEGRE